MASLEPAELAHCAVLQADELLALRSILPAAALHDLGDARVRLVVAPRLPQRMPVVVVHSAAPPERRPPRRSGQQAPAGDAAAKEPAAAGEAEAPVAGPSSPGRATTLQLAHLSPLTLTLTLPPPYPLHAPPVIAALSAPWLPAGSEAHAWLLASLLSQWQEAQSEVLFTWADWLLQGLWEGESPFGTPEGLRLEEKRGTGLVARLLAYEKIASKEEFEGERYGCGICLEERAGTKCVKVEGCGHIFCQECLSGYLGSMIVEGYHRQASSCPDPSCTKARVELENSHSSSAQPTERGGAIVVDDVGTIKDKELLPLVGEEMLGRLGWLRSKAEAEADPTAVVCPRQGCHAIARMNPSDAGTTYESMRECPTCGFTVCAYCLKVWHGRSPCSLASSSALVQEYQSHEPGSVERLKMEQRFGRANLERLVRTEMEEQANREWMEANAKKCPSCAVSIELAFGCHHMTCGKCRTHFCFLCSTRLNPLEPYRHFNTPGKPCYQRLFPNMPHVLDGGAPMGPLGEVNIDDVLAWEAAEL